MKKGFSIIACILAFLLNGMVIQANENEVITDVYLPHNYTELYASLNNESPVFYNELACKINGEDTTVSGITWTSADYDADAVGIYTFSAVAPSGYQFAEGQTPTITVRVRQGENTGIKARSGYFFSRYGSNETYNPEPITGFYGTAVASGNSTKPTAIYDITGFNKIYSTNASNKIKLLGGVDCEASSVGGGYAANPKELIGKIRLEGTTIHSMYGGSFGNIYKGITDIYVTDGILSDGVYAGSVNSDFEGTTNIYISGNSTVEKLYLGSTYCSDATISSGVVGSTDVSYKGTVNVYIADDFTGAINSFEVATGTKDDVTANIYISEHATGTLPATLVSGGKIKVYQGGVLVPNAVTSVTYEGEKEISVALNTAKEALGLGDTLQISCGETTYIESGIEWECEGYSPEQEGDYVFTPFLPSEYDVTGLSALPTVTVRVDDGHMETMEAVTLPFTYTELYAKLNITSPMFYDTIACKINGEDTTVSEISWTSSDYVANQVGTYTFTAVAPEGYAFAEGQTPTITVRVRQGESTGIKSRSGYFFSRYGSNETYNPETITGFYGTAKSSGIDNSKKSTDIYDITGFNKIYSTNASNGIRLLGGVDCEASSVGGGYAANPKELTGKIRLEGTTIGSMYGGSYGNIFKGTTDIYVIDGTLSDGVYAGSVNSDFEGTTNIYISGNSTVPKLYLGSTYCSDAEAGSIGVVGSQDVSYKGTVNVYIADDFTGTIGVIEAATGEKDAVTANIYLSGKAEMELPAIVGGSRMNLFIDNELVSKTVTSIVYEGETSKIVPLNTAKENLGLGDTLKISCGDITYIENGIEWECKEGYSPDQEGYYTFTPVLPESYVVSDASILPTMTILVKDGVDMIEAVSLPADYTNYTELYTKLNITTPVFYDTFTCKVEGVDTTLSGFTWSSIDYKADTVGTYIFTANAPVGYAFAEGAAPTITVRVREAEEDANGYGAIDRFGHFFSNDKYESETLTGFYGMVVAGLDNSAKTRVVDFTGFNPIRSADTSNNIRLMGGVDYAASDLLPDGTVLGNKYAANPTELTSKIALSSGKMHSMYGGSYGNIFKGTTDIYVTGGTLTDGIYAGSVNGDFEGTTNIYLSGNSTIAKLYLGSIYSKDATHVYKGTIVGKKDVSYNGTINVYIADDFTGSIGEIVVPDRAGDKINANIYMSGDCKFDIFSVGYEGANLYIDGNDASKYLSEVKYDGESFIVVPKGTYKADIKLDGTLTIVYGGKEYTETEVEWACDNYSADVPGVYTFTPVLPSKYEPANEPVLPEVTVVVEDSIEIESIDVGIPLETRLPEGITALHTPTTATITYAYAGEQHTAEIAVSYNTENYASAKGEYVLSIESVQAPFTLPEAIAKTAEIKVQVADVTYVKSDNTYSFDNAMIAVLAEERGDYTITDASRLYTYYEDVTVIDAMEFSGEAPALTIESPLVYVENAITFKEIQGEAKAEVAKSLVTKIRTGCPNQVIVNGVCLGSYSDKTVTVVPGKRVDDDKDDLGTFYFNGIPGILARDEEDGGTYAYRSYDMVKLSDTNLVGWDVSGGSQGETSVTESANLRFESGTVYRLFGGGQGTTKDATLVLDGGSVAFMSYGGALENGTVLKATVVYEYGDSRWRAYIGGIDGSVLGDKNKTYGKGEYAAEVWWFDCTIQRLFFGGQYGGDVYGNIKFEQYGGSMLELYSGGYKAAHYGDLDITVYGGLWEKVFKQLETHEGNARLKLYDEIHRKEFIEYPTFEKLNASNYTLEVEYFSRPDTFQFIEYEDKRAEVVDTTEDGGKLVVRFLETKVDDGFEKGKVKIRDGTGDSIYITFPNGQNMLIDSGVKEGGNFIVQDLKDLGVTKLDYVLITHKHSDHVGAIEAISEAFEIENLIYEKYNDYDVLQAVKESEGADAQILGAGDVLIIGEGENAVRFDVIGPDDVLIEKWIAEDDFDRNQTSIAMVMSYGESKVFLGGDSIYDNEKAWLADEEITKLISDCQLMKLNHHGIYNANSPQFLAVVNAEKFVITQMREYGTQLGGAVAQLEGAFGVTWDDIYATGRHGMIKAVVEKDGTMDMSCQYVEKTSTPIPDPDPTPTPTPNPDPDPTPDPTPEKVEIIAEGTDNAYMLNSSEDVSIHCTGNLEDLVSVKMDDQIVDATNYTLREGSTIVTFKTAYLDTLPAGDHKVTLSYSGGLSADATLKVLAKAVTEDDDSDNDNYDDYKDNTESSKIAGGPKTGDNTSAVGYILSLVIAFIALVMILVGKRKRNI